MAGNIDYPFGVGAPPAPPVVGAPDGMSQEELEALDAMLFMNDAGEVEFGQDAMLDADENGNLILGDQQPMAALPLPDGFGDYLAGGGAAGGGAAGGAAADGAGQQGAAGAEGGL